MVSAVLSREPGNLDGGTYIDVAFIDILFSFSQAIAPTSMLFDDDPRPGETLFTGKYPSTNVYETADDRYVVIAAIEDHFWEAFCQAVGREDLVDVRMPDDEAERAALRSELETLFRSRTRDEWMELATDDIPITAVHTFEEAIAHPQIRSRDLVEEHNELPPRIGYPAKPTSEIDGGGTPSPELGQHTAELLREHGYSPDEIEAMRAEGVI
jgi:crotonobetainyl-CoA:carnitine CoA-transferase CaiB-like acyl-CoA transferase